jgi:hypothetical protein
MNAKRKIEVFSAGCPVCEEAIAMVQRTKENKMKSYPEENSSSQKDSITILDVLMRII